jgi:hypothetical protein
MKNKNTPNKQDEINIKIDKPKKINKITMKFPKNYDDFYNIYSTFLFLPISPVIIERKFYFGYLEGNKVHLYTVQKNFKLVASIPLDDLKKINYIGKYSLLLKFYTQLKNEENKIIIIKLLSTYQREVIVDIILPETTNDKIDLEKKSVLYKIIGDNKNYLNEYRLRLIEKLKKSNLVYNNNIYDILHPTTYLNFSLHLKTKYMNQHLFKVMLLVFSETGLVKKVFKILFFNINYIKYDTSDIEEMYNEFLMNFRTHRDSISVEMNRRKENQRRSGTHIRLKEQEDDAVLRKSSKTSEKDSYSSEINSKTFSEGEKDSSINNSVDSIIEEFNQKVRPRHKNNVDMRSKSNYIKQFSHRNSLNNSNSLVVGKAEFDKIIFNITIPKYFGKDHKILEINKNGFFMIYKKEKVLF